MKKIRVGVLFGGRSGEHEVSLLSATSVLNAIDKKKYEVVPIGITKEGRWVTAAHAERLLKGEKPSKPELRHLRAGDPQATSAAAVLAKGEGVVAPPMPGHDHSSLVPFETDAAQVHAAASSIAVDVIFPVLHGTFGEDGTIQGLLELADIPYVGAGVLGSAAGMDKDVMKRLFRDAGLPIVKHVTVLRSLWREQPKKARKLIESTLKYPVFVKPANLGSSVGISKVHNSSELAADGRGAVQFDRKRLSEPVLGQEREGARDQCSVRQHNQCTVPGEISPSKSPTITTAKAREGCGRSFRQSCPGAGS
jgi:D-alanine-D-alanine ligase